MNFIKSYKLAALGLGVVILGTAGCATKKYVQQSIEPLQVGLKNVNQKTADNSDQIRSVDRRAETGIADAQNAASQANTSAMTASQRAQAAREVAEQGVTAANKAQTTADNMDNYVPSQHASVLFGLNKSTLTTEDKQSLDQLIQSVKALKHYAIQVQGFTDATGAAQYNLQLSQKRANAVVRYLSLEGRIPLVKISRLGYGKSWPAAPNSTRAGRAKNRRVDVTILVPQIPGQAAQQAQSSPAGPGQ
jgi:OmpA-OmpF porin, OOP family